jgi:hypothetical protein
LDNQCVSKISPWMPKAPHNTLLVCELCSINTLIYFLIQLSQVVI